MVFWEDSSPLLLELAEYSRLPSTLLVRLSLSLCIPFSSPPPYHTDNLTVSPLAAPPPRCPPNPNPSPSPSLPRFPPPQPLPPRHPGNHPLPLSDHRDRTDAVQYSDRCGVLVVGGRGRVDSREEGRNERRVERCVLLVGCGQRMGRWVEKGWDEKFGIVGSK